MYSPVFIKMSEEEIKPRRKSIRLQEYDYSQPGAYFVTICTHDRNCLFGEIVDGRMILNEMGEIVESQWIKSPEIRSEIELDVFQIMPNHFHAVVFIIHLNDDDSAVGATGRSPLQSNPSNGPRPKSLSSLIAGFKSAVTTNINHFRRIPGAKLWQRNYYDRIIRDDNELNRIREYIICNALKWDLDHDNPQNWNSHTKNSLGDLNKVGV